MKKFRKSYRTAAKSSSGYALPQPQDVQQAYNPSAYAGIHEHYELPASPGPVNNLAVVSPRSDLGFARAMAPPGRYQGEVVSASNFSAGEENDLTSALGFSTAASGMLDAESLDEKGEGSGGGSSELMEAKVVGRSLVSEDEFHHSTSPQAFIHNFDVPLSATLSGPFSLPGPSYPSSGLQSKVQPPASSYPDTQIPQPDPPSQPDSMLTQRQIPRSDTESPQAVFRVLTPRDKTKIALKNQKPNTSSRKKSFCCF